MHGTEEPVEGVSLSEIEQAEQRLGYALPTPLKEFYLTVGAHEPSMNAFNPFSSPQELCNYTGCDEDKYPDLSEQQLLAMDGDLVIATENQGCWCIRYNRHTGKVYYDLMLDDEGDRESSLESSAALSLEQQESAQSEIKSHIALGEHLDQAIVWNLAQQCFNSNLTAGEIEVPSEQLADFKQKLSKYFLSFTSELLYCGNVYYNPELGLVLTGQISPRDGNFYGWIAIQNKMQDSLIGKDLDHDVELFKEEEESFQDFEQTFGLEVSYF